MKKTVSILLCLALILIASSPSASFASDAPELSFDANGEFRILQITDTQDDAYPARDLETFLTLAIGSTQPDLIVFTGDLVEDTRYGDIVSDNRPLLEGVVVKTLSGEIDVEKTRANIEKAVKAVFGVFESFGIPYLIALGNNDHRCGIDNSVWLEIFSAYPHCVVFDESPDESGRLDYRLSVKGTDGADKLDLYIMDSGGNGIGEEQIEWYCEESARLAEERGSVLPALWFQHIPVAEVGNLFVPCDITTTGARMADGGWYTLNSDTASGFNLTGYAPGGSSAVFESWKANGDVIGAFFGHMHVDGFTGTYDGVTLGLTYGCEFTKPGPYGFRTIDLNEEDAAGFKTDLYTYNGSAVFGTSSFTRQSDADETNPFAVFLLRLKSFFLALISILIDIF
ncbi:MAG: metallophosphoesterase [Clostridia bacterium]|nr:metallophosphoesterase [Clostridia bacterium]